MIEPYSKRKKQGWGTGKKNALTCKVMRFHAKKIRQAQRLLPSEKEIRELTNLNTAVTNTWQQKIIIALANGTLCVCNISYIIGLSIPATSHQLRYLHKQKLVSYENDGNMVYYSLTN